MCVHPFDYMLQLLVHFIVLFCTAEEWHKRAILFILFCKKHIFIIFILRLELLHLKAEELYNFLFLPVLSSIRLTFSLVFYFSFQRSFPLHGPPEHKTHLLI
jgi:hypothetical protein